MKKQHSRKVAPQSILAAPGVAYTYIQALARPGVLPDHMKIVDWLNLVQRLIGLYSTAPRKRGKYKGHASTDSVAWVGALAVICAAYLRRRSKRRAYDENMALAALMGLILAAWYAQVHRAKGLDPARPLARRVVFTRLSRWRAELAVATTDERVMGAVWGKQQNWNYPFGRGARGGKFV